MPLPSQDASSVVKEQQLEKELFDIEGILVYFREICVVNYLTDVLYVGFKKELECYSTRDLGHVLAAMNAKALIAGRMLL